MTFPQSKTEPYTEILERVSIKLDCPTDADLDILEVWKEAEREINNEINFIQP